MTTTILTVRLISYCWRLFVFNYWDSYSFLGDNGDGFDDDSIDDEGSDDDASDRVFAPSPPIEAYASDRRVGQRLNIRLNRSQNHKKQVAP